MPTPKLPQFNPPTVPRRRAASTEAPKKGSFFNTLILMFIIIWTLQLLLKKPQVPQQEWQDNPTAASQEPKTYSTEELNQIAGTLSDEVKSATQQPISPEYITLGSLDPSSPYRMLITLSNKGASVVRVEMNEKSFRDCADVTGYLGQIIVDETVAASEITAGLPGLGIQAVGAGTPAEQAGLAVGDRIISVDLSQTSAEEAEPIQVDSFDSFRSALLKTKPGETITLSLVRKGNLPQKSGEGGNSESLQTETVSVVLTEAPLQLIRPMGIIANYDDYADMIGLQGVSSNLENDMADTRNTKGIYRRPNTDPSSFLLTLASYDSQEKLDWPLYSTGTRQVSAGHNYAVDKELPFYALTENGLTQTDDGLRSGNWEYVSTDSNKTTAVFRKVLPGRRLEVRKTYQLSSSPEGETDSSKKPESEKSYHLNLTVTARNLDAINKHSISYFLDGPTSLPVEGLWNTYGRKTGPGWGSYGLRDLVLMMGNDNFHVLRCSEIALEEQDLARPSDRIDLNYIGVDSQYFQSTLIPDSGDTGVQRREYLPIRVGSRISGQEQFTNVTFRIKSGEMTLSPAGNAGDAVSESYTIFIGPKLPKVLESYGLGKTLIYGWFWFFSKPMVAILEFFRHYVVFNYGLAIVLLTILVRLILFPISIKQVASMAKLQSIQPQMEALRKKYGDDQQGLAMAQKELFVKNNVNPVSGCLPIFLQIPVFCGLYKVLSLDVNLYGAPLFSEKINFCSNLAAPDMFWNWSHFWNSIGWPRFNLGLGFFGLGPFFNLLPIITVILMVVIQKSVMPPLPESGPERQKQKAQRLSMKVMMFFMVFFFFKMPCGLCIYIITSSVWGIFERRFLPKTSMNLSSDTANSALIDVQPIRTASEKTSSVKSGLFGIEKKNRKSHINRKGSFTNGESSSKKSWRDKLNEYTEKILEKAKEQQKLAKAEAERRSKISKSEGVKSNNKNSKGKKRR